MFEHASFCLHVLHILIFSQTGYLVLVAISLMARTYCDVWMIQNGTAIEAAIISRNRSLFLKHLMAYVYAMPLVRFSPSVKYNVLYDVQTTVRSLMLNLAIILLDCLGWTNLVSHGKWA